VFVTRDGSPYARFRRALETGNELLVVSAARELPRIALDDALRICLALRNGDQSVTTALRSAGSAGSLWKARRSRPAPTRSAHRPRRLRTKMRALVSRVGSLFRDPNHLAHRYLPALVGAFVAFLLAHLLV
jgi:hypothetical protein